MSDLYHGEVASTIEKAQTLRNGVDRKEATKLMRTAVDYLVDHPAVSSDKIGAIGISYEVGFALNAMRSRPDNVKAAVLLYGSGGGKFDKTSAAFQGHFAANDEWGADAKKITKLKERIVSAGQTADFYTYPHTGHWFFEDGVMEAYDATAAQLVWERTIPFLRQHLA